MYEWRKMTSEQRAAVVEERKRRHYPCHRPPHPETKPQYRIVTATCWEHREILSTPDRLEWFERELLCMLKEDGFDCAAWCVLPNHDHTLIYVDQMKRFNALQGQLHGRTSYQMNGEDNARGRTVWYHAQDRTMRSLAHFWTSVNYIHHNPVKHGYVDKWQEWPYSSVHWYLETNGRDWMLRNWSDYPLKGYGDNWDA